jgi:hypothetical protein
MPMRAAIVCAASVLLAANVANAAATCIRGRDIAFTERPNDKTIVFHMTGKLIYRNDLPVRCPGLSASIDGFSFQPTDPGMDELCDGMVVIRMNDVGHASCIVGDFTKVK